MNIKTLISPLVKRLFNRGSIIQLCLLGGWSLFQYTRGNELYAAYIVLLFMVLLIPRSQNFALIAVSVLVIVSFKTPILDTWIDIRETNLRAFQSFKPSINKLFTPDAGKDVLPNNVQKMLSLLQENNITEYRLAEAFEQDPLTNQRIVESAWPAKKEPLSPYILTPSEVVTSLSDCMEVDKRRDVALVYCP